MLDWLVGALGLLLVLEGLLPLVSPQSWRQAVEKALRLKDGQLRFFGLMSVLTGLVIIFLLSGSA